MKIQNLSAVIVVGCTSSLLINTINQQSAVSQTANQINQLRARGLPVVLPSYTSPGFRFTSFEMHLGDPRGGLRGSRYTTIYDGSNTCEISVNGSTGGWGAPDPVRQWTISTNLFGKVILEEYSGSISRPPYQNYLISSVIPGDDGRGPFAYKGFPKAGYIEPI